VKLHEMREGFTMKRYKFFTVLLSGVMLLGIVARASADSPTPEATPPAKGNFGPGQVEPAKAVLDPTTATVIRREPAANDKGSAGNSLPGDFLGQDISTASLQIIKLENFESAFPNDWQLFDSNGLTGGDQVWSDVPCLARSGSWSGWPAGPDGLNGVNPCAGADYPNDVSSWLIYGPFSLVNAQSASFNFYFRMVSEFCPPDLDTCDWLLAGASIDGEFFSGLGYSGSFTNGPYNNGYFFDSLDLTNIPDLGGDLTGQPQVWVAFYFKSDFSNTAQGPFIDDVSVTFEPLPTIKFLFLPLIIKSPPPVIPKTNLFVKNNTTGPATYTIKAPKLNGVVKPDITCNIALGATVACGTFDSGTYQVRSTSPCGNGQGSRTFPAGNYNLNPPLHCVD
jgi:hypothetical protein